MEGPIRSMATLASSSAPAAPSTSVTLSRAPVPLRRSDRGSFPQPPRNVLAVAAPGPDAPSVTMTGRASVIMMLAHWNASRDDTRKRAWKERSAERRGLVPQTGFLRTKA